MSAQDSLLVRFTPPGGGESLTVECPSDLRFSHEVPGGHKALSCTVVLPAGAATPLALTMLAQVLVVDRRTGRIVWAGELTDPGETSSPAGQRFTVTAEGSQTRTDGWREVYGLVDRAQESWQAVGDFTGGSGSFGGDLTPIDLVPIDLGDINFGDELGDGGINFGDTYPPSADYPGYLGYLKDPSGGPGDMLPIPLGGSGWAGWEEGATAPGGSASGATSASGTVTGGSGVTSRHLISGGLMMPIGYMGPSGAFWSIPGTPTYDPNVIGAVTVTFRLLSSGAAARIMVWADGTLTSNGMAIQAGMDGNVTLVRMDGGVETVLDSNTWTPVIGGTYTMRISPNLGVEEHSATLLSGPYDVAYVDPSISTFLTNGTDTFVGLSYFAPVGTYQVVTPLPGQESAWWLHDGTYWGVGAVGGTVAFDSITANGSGTPE